MGKREVKVWWDAQSDFLSITFDGRDGYMVETTDDRVMAKVDEDGNIAGLHILGLSAIEDMAGETGRRLIPSAIERSWGNQSTVRTIQAREDGMHARRIL